MLKSHCTLVAAVAVSVLGLSSVLSQDLPQTQPNLLTIIREQVKVGRAVDHAKHEAGWPAAFAKAKSPNHYLAMSALLPQPHLSRSPGEAGTLRERGQGLRCGH